MTGDPHLDSRLEPWRPSHHGVDAPPDALPTEGRERRARIALILVLGLAVTALVSSVVVAVAGSGA